MVKSVYKAVYMYKSVFMFFGKGDEQLALDADSVVCRKKEGGVPPSSLYGTLLCRRGCVNKNINIKVAGSARHPGRSTFYALLPVGGVRGQPPGLTAPPSSFQPPRPLAYFLPSFLPFFLFGPVMSLLPPCCGVTGQQRLLLAASPVDTVVMSLPPGSTIGHPRPPQWAASLVYSVGEWGVEPRRDGETV